MLWRREASWWTAAAAACPRGLSSARPDAQCSVFFLIGRRPVACSAIVLRLALREGRPISRARAYFTPGTRVDLRRLRQQWLAASADNFPERLLGRAHIAHLFYPSQYSPLVTCPLFLRLVFSSLPRGVRPVIPRVHQRWLAASADNFPFMLVDVSRATRAREQLYTAIVSSRRRLSCSSHRIYVTGAHAHVHSLCPTSTRLRLVYVSFFFRSHHFPHVCPDAVTGL